METYRISDEPRLGGLSRVAVNPFWPLLGLMLGGAWLAWPWFVVNSFAIGSATRVRETVLAASALVVSAVVGASLLVTMNLWDVDPGWFKYGLLAVIVPKLGFGYWLYVVQARSFALYEYFDGTVRNGLFVVIGAFFVRGAVINAGGLLLFKLVLA